METIPEELRAELMATLRNASEEEAWLYLTTRFTLVRPPPRARIDLSQLGDDELRRHCRFPSRDLGELPPLLGLPSHFSTSSGARYSQSEGLFFLCSRLGSREPLGALAERFGLPESALAECVDYLVEYIDEKWSSLLQDHRSCLLTEARLDAFARKVALRQTEADVPWPKVYDFLAQPIARPSEWRRACGGGDDRPALDYTPVKCPDGLIYHIFESYEPLEDDSGGDGDTPDTPPPVGEDSLLSTLVVGMRLETEETMENAPASSQTVASVVPPFSELNLEAEEQLEDAPPVAEELSPFEQMNALLAGQQQEQEEEVGDVSMASMASMASVTSMASMASVESMASIDSLASSSESARRRRLEWGYGDVIDLWEYVDDIVSQQPLEPIYRVAVIMANIHICIYGCDTALYFSCAPPEVRDYLREPGLGELMEYQGN